MATVEKDVPTRHDLLAWFLWDKLAISPIADFDDPDKIKEWVMEFGKAKLADTHERLYDRFPRFVEKFCDPETAGGAY